MIEACAAAGVPLWVAYYRRTLPRFVKIKELLAEGAIGEVRAVTVRFYARPPETSDPNNLPWRVVPEIAGGGRFVDLASHTFDYLDYVLGPISQVTGFAANQAGLYPAEDIVTSSFAFESGSYGTGVWCFTAAHEFDENEIIGSKGRLTFSTFGAEPVRLTTAAGLNEFPIAHPDHVHQPLIQTIVNELNGQGHCPSTGQSGARTSWVMDQLLRGYYQRS
jgi:predicted dehydrogenase